MKTDYVQPSSLIYQQDSRFVALGAPRMKPSGCFYMSILEALCGCLRVPFTVDLSASFFAHEIASAAPDVENDMTVDNAQKMLDDFCDLVGKGKFLYLVEGGSAHLSATRTFSDEEIEWGSWHKTGNAYNHFTHNNGAHVVLYDPWSVDGSDSVSDGSLISCRGARRLL